MKENIWVKLYPFNKNCFEDHLSKYFKVENNYLFANKDLLLGLNQDNREKVFSDFESVTNRKVIMCSADDISNYRVCLGRVYYKGGSFSSPNKEYGIDNIVFERSKPVIRLVSQDGIKQKTIPLDEAILIN